MWNWIKRKLFNWVLRLAVKSLWQREYITTQELQHLADKVCAWLPLRGARPGRPEYIPQHCEGEWFEPVGSTPTRVLLYLHGGAWITRAPRLYRGFARRLAQQLNARVFLPDYRLAPEYRFPVGADDALAAYKHVLAQGVSPAQLLIAGDSAGGNLALVTLLRARDEGLPLPACGFLLSPVTDASFSGDSVRMNQGSDVLFTSRAAAFIGTQYLDNHDQVSNPWVSPLNGDLHGLPPLLFQASDSEMLLNDSTRFVERVRAAGGKAEMSTWHDVPHVFQVIGHFLDESKAALSQVAAFVDHVTSASAREKPPAVPTVDAGMQRAA